MVAVWYTVKHTSLVAKTSFLIWPLSSANDRHIFHSLISYPLGAFPKYSVCFNDTVCPRSIAPIYIVPQNMKCVKTSWSYSAILLYYHKSSIIKVKDDKPPQKFKLYQNAMQRDRQDFFSVSPSFIFLFFPNYITSLYYHNSSIIESNTPLKN